MPKATLEFDLIEEKEEYYDAVHGGTYRYILKAIDDELRAKLKYGNVELTKEEEQAYRLVRQRIIDLVIEENLEF